VTRIEAVKILHGSLGVKETTTFIPTFNDVKTNHWAYDELSVLTEKGIIENVEKFNPQNNLTRAEMAKLISVGFKLTEKTSGIFEDVPKGVWYEEYVNKLVAAGITVGKSPGNFDPQGKVTRAEMVAFINRALVIGSPHFEIPEGMDLSMYPEDYMKKAVIESIERINLEREKVGALPVVFSPELARFSMWKANDMKDMEYFSHETPEGLNTMEQMMNFGINGLMSSKENIAYTNNNNANQTYNLWMNSPGHKGTILMHYTNWENIPKNPELGIGIAKDSEGNYYWENIFKVDLY